MSGAERKQQREPVTNQKGESEKKRIFATFFRNFCSNAKPGHGKGRLRAGSRGVAAPRKAATQNWPIYMRLCFCSTVVARRGRLNFNFEFFFARVSAGETNAKCQSLAGAEGSRGWWIKLQTAAALKCQQRV